MELALYVIILNNSFNQHGDFLQFYSIFHINTSFSSIEKRDLKKVIKSCYWPLLNLSIKSNYKISIEASANSLLEIKKVDSFFIKKLKYLIKTKKVEFIGSGYCQSIFPLIPFEVNNMNLKLGNEIYKKILGLRPRIALVNEQIFSSSLIPIYKKNGYEALIIDWKNCKLANEKLSDKLQFSSQLMKYNNDVIKIVWANSLNFQKFQNYVHGEISKEKYFKFLKKISKRNRNICLYSNDVEIFNFRPGRFSTEKKLNSSNEWDVIEKIYEKVTKNNRLIFISDLLKKGKKRLVKVFNSKNPIISKKQPKYNIIRWSLSGRDNLYINTQCFKFYNYLVKKKIKDKKLWQSLCLLWSSDFRTHITEKRWNEYLKKIDYFKKKFNLDKSLKATKKINYLDKNKINLLKSKNFIIISNGNKEIYLNKNKGLTIESYTDHKISKKPIIGKIEKGFFNKIDRDVDFFSGFFQLYDRQNNKKITDLSKQTDNLKISFNENLIIKNRFKFGRFVYDKKLIFDLQKNKFAINNTFKNFPLGFLRFNYITLNPNNFNFSELFYETANGGKRLEKFKINDLQFDHGEHVSSLCSATNGLGSTSGITVIGDNKKKIKISNDDSKSNLISMIQNEKITKKNLFRFYHSGMEYDDTSKSHVKKNFETFTWFTFSL